MLARMDDEATAIEQVLDEDAADKLMSGLMARIPIGAGSDKQQRYLAYRSTGFSASQATKLCGIKLSTLRIWRKQNPLFRRMEDEYLSQLQTQVGNEVVRFEYLRNMRLLLAKDSQLFMSFFTDPESLSEREWEYFKTARKHYTPSDLLALEKILHPESQARELTVKLTWANGASDEEPIEATYQEVAE